MVMSTMVVVSLYLFFWLKTSSTEVKRVNMRYSSITRPVDCHDLERRSIDSRPLYLVRVALVAHQSHHSFDALEIVV